MAFSKNYKNMLTKQESVSNTACKTWPFSSNFNFPFKDGRVNASTCKYSCPLDVSPTITNCSKVLHLICGRVPICLWKCCHARNLVWLCVETSIFYYYFEMLSPLSKVIVFFCTTFYGMMKYFLSGF